MGRIAVIPCPSCGHEPLRRVYLQNPATSDRPRNEPIEGWLYCEGCHKMSGGQITPPRRKPRKTD